MSRVVRCSYLFCSLYAQVDTAVYLQLVECLLVRYVGYIYWLQYIERKKKTSCTLSFPSSLPLITSELIIIIIVDESDMMLTYSNKILAQKPRAT